MSTKGSKSQPATILAVDDDFAILTLIEAILGREEYKLLLANGGWKALEEFQLADPPVSLLITDVIMPDLTGPVLASKLRAQRPELRVLFISGFRDSELVQGFMSNSGFALLPKPFTPSALLRAVEHALANGRR